MPHLFWPLRFRRILSLDSDLTMIRTPALLSSISAFEKTLDPNSLPGPFLDSFRGVLYILRSLLSDSMRVSDSLTQISLAKYFFPYFDLTILELSENHILLQRGSCPPIFTSHLRNSKKLGQTLD
jgi:hypothetical protein